MTKQSKTTKATVSLTKAAPAKAAKPEKAAKAPAEKAPKVDAPKVGKYGAPAQRINRVTHGRSEFGDRKWIYRGVTEANLKTNEVLATDAKQCKAFPLPVAQKLLEKALTNKDVVNGRLFHKKTAEDGTQMRSVWVAYASDNGDHRIQKTA